MKRFVQYYDKNRNEIGGSDGVWVFDQRFANHTMICRVIERAAKQAAYYRANPDKYAPQRAAYARLMRGEICCASPITEFISLKHN